METAECPHCGAPIRPTATFCLACDTPIVDTERGLSVADPIATPKRRRPLLRAAVLVVVLVVLGGSTYGVVHFVHGRHQNAEDAVTTSARDAVTLLVRAESGQTGACHRVVSLVSGTERRHNCQAIFGHDPGVHLTNVRTSTPHLVSTTGTLRLTATVVDAHTSRTLVKVCTLVEKGHRWRLEWDGAPLV